MQPFVARTTKIWFAQSATISKVRTVETSTSERKSCYISRRANASFRSKKWLLQPVTPNGRSKSYLFRDTVCEVVGDYTWISTCLPRNYSSGTVKRIQDAGAIGCVRFDSADIALQAARAALSAGLPVLEVTCTTPGAMEVLAQLAQEFPDAILGAGTVMSREEARAACEAGATFLMSPGTDQELVRWASSALPVLFIPGVMTPSEMMAGGRMGLPFLKLFPAGAAGGTALVRSMKLALPRVGLIPAHDIRLHDVATYLLAGASAVVLSNAIFDKAAVQRDDYSRISRLAQAAMNERDKAREMMSNII